MMVQSPVTRRPGDGPDAQVQLPLGFYLLQPISLHVGVIVEKSSSLAACTTTPIE
jgi:hypothetical protein